MPGNDSSVTVPQIGGKFAIFLFIITLLGFVAETQLAQVHAIAFNSSRNVRIQTIYHLTVCSDWSWIQTSLLYLVREEFARLRSVN